MPTVARASLPCSQEPARSAISPSSDELASARRGANVPCTGAKTRFRVQERDVRSRPPAGWCGAPRPIYPSHGLFPVAQCQHPRRPLELRAALRILRTYEHSRPWFPPALQPREFGAQLRSHACTHVPRLPSSTREKGWPVWGRCVNRGSALLRKRPHWWGCSGMGANLHGHF